MQLTLRYISLVKVNEIKPHESQGNQHAPQGKAITTSDLNKIFTKFTPWQATP